MRIVNTTDSNMIINGLITILHDVVVVFVQFVSVLNFNLKTADILIVINWIECVFFLLFVFCLCVDFRKRTTTTGIFIALLNTTFVE